MMRAFGVARDLGADHARRVGVVRRAAHAPDGVPVEHLDLQRAGRRAVVRTGRRENLRTDRLVHYRSCLIVQIWHDYWDGH